MDLMNVSFLDPLGYDIHRGEYGSALQPCPDLEHFLAWIFWRAGNFIDLDVYSTDAPTAVFKIRHSLLTCLCFLDWPMTPLELQGKKYQVSSEICQTSLCLRFNTPSQRYLQYLCLEEWNKEDISKAIHFNRDLPRPYRIPQPSPFGAHDIVMPPDVPLKPTIENSPQRKIRMINGPSEIYLNLISELNSCPSVFRVQVLLEKGMVSSLSEKEFHLFVNCVTQRVRWLRQNATLDSIKRQS